MPHSPFSLACAALALAFLPVLHADPPAPQSLFDGKTLDGWIGDPASWRVEDGAITGEIPAGATLGRNEFLFWKGETNDFDLTAEFRITGLPSANSGIQYRSRRLPNGEAAGYQADLDDGATWLGRVYEENGRGILAERGARVSIAPDGRRWSDPFSEPASFRPVIKAAGWNLYHVRATASHVELWVNGVLFSELDDHQAAAAKFGGQLAFQLHSGPGPSKIQFRNIQLTNLGATKPPAHPEKEAQSQAASVPAIKPLGPGGKTLNLDFETGALDGWTAEGDAWTGQPVKGDTVQPRKPGERSNHQGDYWIGGYERIGDKGTGRLTSSSFEVTHPWASFLIGGGKDAKMTRVEIVEDGTGKVLHTASGQDVETMRREVVDLRGAAGHKIFVRLVDEGTTGWNHLNFDDFVFHDQQPLFSPAIAAAGGTRQQTSPVLWHLQPNPAKPTAVPNAGAQKLVADMMLTSGFQAELIAAEPEVKQPIAFAIDDRGRLWVAEAYSYPAKQPEGQGKDRIVIFEDPKGDGSYSKRKVFIEGLNLVSGLEVGYGGVWVGAAPQLLFIPDRNHDDIPDGPPEVLLDGFGYQDTHETINSFSWGPDGWLYGNQGVFNTARIGKPGTPDDQRIEMHSAVWRYHPTRHEFEVYAHGGSNQWGLDFNEMGNMFITHCRSFYGGGGTTNVIRNGHFWNQSNNNFAPFISNSAPDFAPDLKNFLPASAKYDSGEGGAGKPGSGAIYGGHSHVGTMIYLGDNWPEIYRDHLFTNNLFGQQMNQQENIREGSAYETLHAGYDLMWTPDPLYLAVDLQTGPDGAVYLIDWCDLQHCHNPDPEKWDRTNGRIYRVSWAETYHPVKVDLGAMSDVELAHLQTHHNDWYVRTARQLLQERAVTGKIDPAAIAVLDDLLRKSPNPAHSVRGLWALYVIGALDQARLEVALASSNDLIRAWAIQLATEIPQAPALPVETLVRLAREDPSPAVRLALASAMPALPAEASWKLVAALAAHGEDAQDRFLPKMIWFGLGSIIAQDFAKGLDIAAATPLPSLADSIRWYVATNPQGRELLTARLATDPPETALRGLRILSFALKNEASAPMPKSWPAAQTRLTAGASRETQAVLDQVSALFGDKAVLARMRAVLGDDERPMEQRKTAFELLKRVGDPEATPVFARLLDLTPFRSAVIPLLARSDDPATATALITRFASFNDADRTAALATLTSRPALALPLLQAAKDGAFDKHQIGSYQVRQLQNLHNPEIDRILDAAWGKVNDSSDAAKATIARLKKTYSQAPLWAYDTNAGKQAFEQTCAVCHARNGVGGKLGPDLAGSWRNGLDYFLENIVDPDAVVGDAYQMTVINKHDGSVVTGILDQETATAVTLRTITGPAIVPKAEIAERQKLAQSLMPPGLLEALPERKMIELLKFLTSKD